jgi:hypothetical protein
MFTETGCGTDYRNCINANALLLLQGRQHCETGLLQQEYAGLTFLASFAREVGASLNPQEVVLATAKLLYKYFHYDLAVFSLSADSGGLTAFSPLDAAGRMRVFLMARENFPELKPKRDKRLLSSGSGHSGTGREFRQLSGSCGNSRRWN